MSNQLIQIVDRTTINKTDNITGNLHDDSRPLDLDAVRARLSEQNGQGFWRSLEELADEPEFARYLEREFPRQAPRDMAPIPRRDFLKLMGAALALAGVSGCAFQPREEIVPYVKQPEELTAGIPLFYATAMSMSGYALGLLAESHMGRPTKLEGNPDHPASLGAADVWAQASVLSLWDPDRSQAIRKIGGGASWDDFLGAMRDALEPQAATGGAGIHILTETITSPSMAAQMRAIKARFPNSQWHQYEPVSRDNVREGVRQSFGSGVEVLPRFDAADVILSLDCDFLLEEPGHVRNAREFSTRRRARRSEGTTSMNRLYVAESTPSITGAMADHCVRTKASDIENIARAIAGRLGLTQFSEGAAPRVDAKWLDAVVSDLQKARGRSIVCAGQNQPPVVHVLAHAINDRLGNLNATVRGVASVEAQPTNQTQAIKRLHSEMKAGRVDVLLIVGGNPLYNAPADLDFQSLLDPQKNQRAPLSVHLSHYDDETSAWCTWHIPETHYLESWSDVRALDGTVSIVQPLIQPLYPEARSAHEVLAALTVQPNLSAYETVQSYWMEESSIGPRRMGATGAMQPGRPQASSNRTGGVLPGGAQVNGVQSSGSGALSGGVMTAAQSERFGKDWQKWIHDGIVPDTKAPTRPLTFRGAAVAAVQSTSKAGGMELMFRPDPTVWDGRYANNAWLQELPKPLTKLTWDNAAIVSFSTAQKLGVTNDDLVDLALNGRKIQAAIHILPGHPDDAVTLHLGYGRTRVGKIGNETGFNAYKLRTSDAMWFASGLQVTPAKGRYTLARTAHHNLIDSKTKTVDGLHDRPLVQWATFEEWKKNGRTGVEEETVRGLPVLGEVQEGKIEYPKPGLAEHAPAGEHGAQNGAHANGQTAAHTQAGAPAKPDASHKAESGHSKPKGYNSLYPDARDTVIGDREASYAWGMLIDTTVCIGCNACVIGCQAENNSAVTGKQQVSVGREMHWLRIDTYYKGSVDNPETYFQPVTCMHCEKAPCEPVCPVEATLHSPEGINEMIYNRCIGTRYCSNNCPYKVRRFNYLQYSDQETPQIQLMANPDVTVRARGVMEKCTYCMQRVNNARIQAEKEDRLVRDGEVLTACQQTCPTDAITFGDIKNEKSKVSKLKAELHNYGMLTELNTYPRTTYLAKIVNPNPALPRKREAHGGEEHSSEREAPRGVDKATADTGDSTVEEKSR